MSLQGPSLQVNQALIGIFYGFAFITTFLRLFYQWRRQRLWWDDFWVVCALVCHTFVVLLCLILPIQFLRQHTGSNVLIFRSIASLLGTTLARWAARLSLAVAIVRLVPDSVFRRVCKAASYLFFLSLVGCSLQNIFWCGTRWHKIATSSCRLSALTVYLDVSTDIVGDLWLIGAPAYMLWRMRLSTRHRLLFMFISSASILVIVSSIAHAYFLVKRELSYISITGHIELGISIVVCNLLVLVTWVYRVLQRAIHNSEIETTEEGRGYRHPNREECPAPAHNLMERLPTSPRTVFTLTDLDTSFEREHLPHLYSTFDNPPSRFCSESVEPDLPTLTLADQNRLDSSVECSTNSHHNDLKATPNLQRTSSP